MSAHWPPGLEISDKPLRRVVTRGARRTTKRVLSTKPLGTRVAESAHEEQFLKIAQLDPRVTLVRAQPCPVHVMIEGRRSRRVPDFAVIVDGAAEIHEVKEVAQIAEPGILPALHKVRKEVERHPGWSYSLTTDMALWAEPLATNVTTLWRRFAEEYQPELKIRTLSVVGDRAMTAKDVVDRTAGTDDMPDTARSSWERLLSMIADGVLDFDPDHVLTVDSLIWAPRLERPRPRMLPFASPEVVA